MCSPHSRGRGAIGLLLGGVLTQFVGWRWCLYVNVAFAAVALVGALLVLPRSMATHRPRLDLAGTVTASGGLFCVVFGLASAETGGWSSPAVSIFLAVGLALLVVFVRVQQRVRAPLLPLRVVLDRYRGGAFLTIFVINIGMFALSLFLTFVLQQNLGLSPLLTGLAILPMTVCIVTASNTVPALLLPHLGPKPLLVAALLLDAGALFWLSRLTEDTGYVVGVLGPLMLFGLGMGTAISTSMNIATVGVEASYAGVASAVVNTTMQIGGAVGIALLSSIAGTAATVYAATHPAAPSLVALHGYTAAFAVAAAVFVGGALVLGVLVPRRLPHRPPPSPRRPRRPGRPPTNRAPMHQAATSRAPMSRPRSRQRQASAGVP